MDAGSGSPFATYDPGACFCEMLHGHAAGSPHGRLVRERFASVPIAELRARARDAEIELYNQGITFTVYSDGDAIDRILPFDVIPRIITAADWARDRGRRAPARAGAQPVPAPTSTAPQKVLEGRRSSRPSWCWATPTTGRRCAT